jgi:hypothetical protein
MWLSVNSDSPVSAAIKGMSAADQEDVQKDIKFYPSVDLFERFGVCGTCIVYCRRGAVRLRDLQTDDEVLTRSQGWVRAFCMLVHSSTNDSGETPLATFVGKGCLGDGLPQEDLALGANHLVTRYVVPPDAKRPLPVSLKLSSKAVGNTLKDCSVGELCVLVFDEPTEIYIQGIYAMCPERASVTIGDNA